MRNINELGPENGLHDHDYHHEDDQHEDDHHGMGELRRSDTAAERLKEVFEAIKLKGLESPIFTDDHDHDHTHTFLPEVTEENAEATITVDAAATVPFGTMGEMADYLVTGYWSRDGGTGSARSHNVTDTGTDPNNGVLYYNVTGYDRDVNGITEERAVLVREAFKVFEATLGIEFVETTSTDPNVVDFFFRDNGSTPLAGTAVSSNGEIGVSYINIPADYSGGTSTYQDFTLQTIFHEIGHAMGLGHQGGYTGTLVLGTDNDFANDSWQTSMMSYIAQSQNPDVDADYALLQTPMSVDWMALNDLYGSQGYGTSNAFTEDTVWGFNTTITSDVSDIWAQFSNYADRTASTIVDGGGIDTLDLSGFANNTLINLAPADRDSITSNASNLGGKIGNLTIAEGSIIENAIGGAGSETFIGNVADNRMVGNGGNDVFFDSAGSDTYIGGSGTDTVKFDGAFADFTYAVADGFLNVANGEVDLVDSSVEWIEFSDGRRSWDEVANAVNPNRAPVASDDTASVSEDGTVLGNVLINDSDPDGDALTVTSVNGRSNAIGTAITLASGAIVTMNADGTYDYDTNGAFNALADGQTATDGFSYAVSDGGGGVSTATVGVTITGVPEVEVAPVAANDSAAVSEDATVTGNVLSNDTDSNNDALSVTAVNGAVAAVGSQIALSSGAMLTLNANGTYAYDPNGAFDALAAGEAANDTFSYTVSDGKGGFDTATVTIAIEGVSPAPVESALRIDFEAAPLGDYVGEDGISASGLTVASGTALSGGRYAQTDGFTLSATGEDFDLNSLSLQSAGGRVRVTLEAWDDGVLVASQNVNLRGGRTSDVSFGTGFDSVDEVRVKTNGTFYIDNLSLVTRSVVEPGGNIAPVAVNDMAATGEARPVTFNLLANDSDADGGVPTLVSVGGDSTGSVTLKSGAVVSFASDGTITYDPNGAYDALYDGQSANDTFAYQISDGQDGTAQATATVTVAGSGAPPPAPTAYQIGFEGSVFDGILAEEGFVFTDVAPTTARLGVSEGNQAVRSNGDSITVARSDGTDFDLQSAVVTALSGKNVTLSVEAFDDGVLIATDTVRIRDSREASITFDDARFDAANTFVFSANGGMIIDDMLLIG